jgi:hypothetical protein
MTWLEKYEKYKELKKSKGIERATDALQIIREVMALYGNIHPVDRYALCKHIENEKQT